MKSVKFGKYVVPLWLVIVLLVSGFGGVLGYYVWKTLTIPIEVKEPLEILYYPSELSLYPGETEEFNVTMENHASANYSVTLDFSLDNTSYQDSYVTFSDEIYTVTPGQQNLTAWLMVESYAPPVNASLTIDFMRISEEVSFFDDFNTSALNTRWNIIDTDGGSTFDLSVNSGWLRITTISPPWRDLYRPVGMNAPRIMLFNLSGNFTIETKLMVTTDEEWESGGILVWKDSYNFIRLDRACGMDNSQRILFVATKDGVWTPVDTILSSNINPTYLKLVWSGNLFSSYYSVDGMNWNHVGDLTFSIDDPIDIGLLLVNVYHEGTFFADFDYFKVTETP